MEGTNRRKGQRDKECVSQPCGWNRCRCRTVEDHEVNVVSVVLSSPSEFLVFPPLSERIVVHERYRQKSSINNLSYTK